MKSAFHLNLFGTLAGGYLLAAGFAGAFAAGLAAGVAAGFAGVFATGFALAAAALAFAGALAAGAVFVFVLAAGVEAPAGRAPLSSFGLSTTFFAKKFSILASFMAIA